MLRAVETQLNRERQEGTGSNSYELNRTLERKIGEGGVPEPPVCCSHFPPAVTIE